jgi:hypothetical protein
MNVKSFRPLLELSLKERSKVAPGIRLRFSRPMTYGFDLTTLRVTFLILTGLQPGIGPKHDTETVSTVAILRSDVEMLRRRQLPIISQLEKPLKRLIRLLSNFTGLKPGENERSHPQASEANL